jgi:hypothetical protein
MPTTFVDDGFVTAGFIDDAVAVSSPGLTPPVPGQHWTDFREYRRGRLMGDWQPMFNPATEIQVEGNFIDLADKNFLRLQGPDARAGVTWKAPTNDVGYADQEERFRVRFIVQTADRNIGALRVSGTIGAENCYFLRLGPTGMVIGKFVAGVSTDLMSSATGLSTGVFYNVAFRATGTTLRAKFWADGTAESGWTLTTTDASIVSGAVGLLWNMSTEIAEVHYFSCATNGQTAPSEDAKDEAMRQWITEPDETMETTLRVEYYNPVVDAVQEAWFSSHPRVTGPTDYPANTRMYQLLDAGVIASKVEADAFLSGAGLPTRNNIVVSNQATSPNSSGPLSVWSKYSFYGRPIEVRVNKLWKIKPGLSTDYLAGVRNLHRRSEIAGFAIPSKEPDISGDQISFQVGPPVSYLSKEVPVERNIGISTGVKSLTSLGYLSVPSNTNYNQTSFVIYARVFIPTAGIAGTSYGLISQRFHTATSRLQWEIIVFQASYATTGNRHRLWFRATANDGTNLFTSISSPALNTNEFHHIIAGLSSGNSWYLNIDGKHIDGGVLTKTVQVGDSATSVLSGMVGCIYSDHRIETYVDEKSALARFSTRRDPDVITISMHRGDDNTGSTVTDYATIANHGTLQGVNNTDRSWYPTFLGSVEITGSPMPMSGGVLSHAPTQNIDPLRSIYRYNDRAKTTGTALEIRVQGAVLTPVTDYAELAEGPGTADLNPSGQPVTYGLTKDLATLQSTATHVAQLVSDTLTTRELSDRSNTDLESFLALRKTMPVRGGFNYPQPPTVSKFLDDNIGSTAGCYALDRDARLAVGTILPTINPDPYLRMSNLLEFTGLPNGGVTLSDVTGAYALTQTAGDFGVVCWFKITRPIVPDLSISTVGGDYSQPGYTIIDKMAGTTKGYYLGIDGDTGALRFAAGGVNFGGGLHYATIGNYSTWKAGTWYAVSATVQDGHWWLETANLVYGPLGGDGGSVGIFNVTGTGIATGTLTDSTGIPLRIGHGPMGGFVGSICYTIGCSPAQDPPSYSPLLFLPVQTFGTDRFSMTLMDGVLADQPYESAQGIYARAHGCRWCPSLVVDLKRSQAQASLVNVRTPVPATRITVPFKVNLQVLSNADIVASVSVNVRSSLINPDQENPRLTNIDDTKYAGGRQVKIENSVLYDQTGSQAVADLLDLRLSVNTRYAELMELTRSLLSVALGDEIVIYDYHPDFVSGRAGRVINISGSLSTENGSLGLWG